MTRRNFTRAIKIEIVKRASAKRVDGQPNCERCGAIGCKMEVHHIDMDAMQIDKSRKLTAVDGELLCEPCHDPITSQQRKQLAKAQRCEAKDAGVAQPTDRPVSRRQEKVRKDPNCFPTLLPPRLYEDR